MYERTKLTHVAIRFEGKVYSLPAPNRHHHLIGEILKDRPDVTHIDGGDEGFLDESGTFLNRRQAIVSAQLFGQIKPGAIIRAGELTSEDVW